MAATPPARHTEGEGGGGAFPSVIAVVGATGTGKSELSLAVAERIAARGGFAEVVNADAMQLYRGMDIGTAKLPPEERRGVPHHLLDVLDVTDEASVAAYQPAARAAIDDIVGRGGTAILVGGSGLYVSSVVFDFRFPARDEAVRARLEAELAGGGVRMLYDRLKGIDPQAAASIGQFNGRRLVRALEVVELTGEPVSGTLPDEPVLWRPAAIVRLGVLRERLVERLDARVERMWAEGLVDEVAGLVPRGLREGVTASRAIGYAQALAQHDGTMTEADAIAEAQALTRRYARRQVSWFKRYPNALDADALDAEALEAAAATLTAP
ncbi:tRNA (adenosine(37)-N6)-dimethylallyltransferase MiaA [Herbiconiux sp. VKM Ac-2851]|uniref:tRNA (adenosine(37)-N6)-dimethylallyltransferase MiaA n=1 Tax=Herbiconiux sp. VKM Ac-2851 TaxID=2739025 RepID=UPI0015672B1F|nr:tRNA (adenosine(37)-N6)-dimethylallyltransferase MiaA [Herbiconiux sp. VKM Ac-2851]NQX36696.1 tRNA (adenosine(37)-N6)-dimethylallyltransferase MiaA [Herbiconiux sp. VKM Ac-2851]